MDSSLIVVSIDGLVVSIDGSVLSIDVLVVSIDGFVSGRFVDSGRPALPRLTLLLHPHSMRSPAGLSTHPGLFPSYRCSKTPELSSRHQQH